MTQRRFTILVVDDDGDARLIMRAALRKAGFEVRLAAGGEDALRQFRAAPCDLVMLDVDLPGMDGHAVCATLRAEAGPLLPIVMVTGMDDVQSVEAAYDYRAPGADGLASPPSMLLGRTIAQTHQRHHGPCRGRPAAAMGCRPFA